MIKYNVCDVFALQANISQCTFKKARLGVGLLPTGMGVEGFAVQAPQKIFEILATQKISPILYLELKKRP